MRIASYPGMDTSRLAWILATVLLAFTSGDAAAGSLDIVINGKSHHVNSEYDWNEDNLGLGFEYEFAGSSRWIKTLNANTFVDSLENQTYMAGAGLKRRLLMMEYLGGLYLDAGIVAFLMQREDINDGNVFPGLLPALTIGNRYAGINLTYLPEKAVHDVAHANVVDPSIGGVFFMQFKFRLTHEGR